MQFRVAFNSYAFTNRTQLSVKYVFQYIYLKNSFHPFEIIDPILEYISTDN